MPSTSQKCFTSRWTTCNPDRTRNRGLFPSEFDFVPTWKVHHQLIVVIFFCLTGASSKRWRTGKDNVGACIRPLVLVLYGVSCAAVFPLFPWKLSKLPVRLSFWSVCSSFLVSNSDLSLPVKIPWIYHSTVQGTNWYSTVGFIILYTEILLKN